MGLFRLITIALLAWIFWFMYKNYIAKQDRKENGKVSNLKTVKCRYCEVHLPQDEAVRHEADWFCSQAHKKSFLENK